MSETIVVGGHYSVDDYRRALAGMPALSDAKAGRLAADLAKAYREAMSAERRRKRGTPRMPFRPGWNDCVEAPAVDRGDLRPAVCRLALLGAS